MPDFIDNSTSHDAFNVNTLWQRGFTGQGIKVAIFDTGITTDRTNFPNIVHESDWTGENNTQDKVGHGTFVAGLIGGHNVNCAGVSPDVSLYIFKVFTGTQVSYTSWFLDAFNYALHLDIDILNLSIGGPDFGDKPFVEKINELTSNGIIIVSAIGNDGPVWGSINNPGDMMDVVGVGAIEHDESVARFSSRGMSMHELEIGFGRMKPDLLALGRSLKAQGYKGGCRRLSGTSVASPVVAGGIALLMSSGENVNVARIKMALIEGGRDVKGSGYERGGGVLDVEGAYQVLKNGRNVSAFPNSLDLRREGCEYMWPHCAQGVWKGAWIGMNLTLFDARGVRGRVRGVEWRGGRGLKVEVKLPERFWPWSGGLGVRFGVEGEELGVVEGMLRIDLGGEFVDVDVGVEVVKKPEIVVWWDMFHSVRYPSGYLPRDNLKEGRDMLDWLGDHPWTNYRGIVRELIREGVGVQVLQNGWGCEQVDGVVVIADAEEFWGMGEIEQLTQWVKGGGGMVVLAEWFNENVIKSVAFEDDNTKSWWKAVMGGGNVPALNQLLQGLGVELGNEVVSGFVEGWQIESGVSIVKMNQGEILEMDAKIWGGGEKRVVVGGILRVNKGVLVVLGDSNCIDSAYGGRKCYDLFVRLVQFVGRYKNSTRALPKFWESSRWGRVNDGEGVEVSEELIKLFLPHSRVLQIGNEGIKTSDARIHEACRFWKQGWQSVNISKSSGVKQVFPRMKKAHGLEVDYLQVVKKKVKNRRYGTLMILFGLILILMSFLLRRVQQKTSLRAILPRSRSSMGKSSKRSSLRAFSAAFARED